MNSIPYEQLSREISLYPNYWLPKFNLTIDIRDKITNLIPNEQFMKEKLFSYINCLVRDQVII